MSEIKTNKLSPRKGTTQTIGDSGDTVSIASGATLSNAGTISTAGITGGTIDNQGTITGLAGVINWDTTAKTTGFTAVSNTGYFCNTTSAAFTVTLPATPTAGDVIAIKDYANTFDTNNLILNPNGNKIQGSTENFDITIEGASSQFIYVDATRGWVLTDASKASDIAEDLKFVTATGGTITTSGDYKIHTFTSPGTFTVTCAGNPAGSTSVDYLVVAGGGGGGSAIGFGVAGSSGGGAGGYRESSGAASGCYSVSPLGTGVSALPVSVTGYPITVGAGGTGSTGPGDSPNATQGSSSIFSSITSTGGGYGVGAASAGSGGSGGGGSWDGGASQSGGAGNTPPVSPPQGNNGGNALLAPPYVNGGGGGAGAAGVAATPSSSGAGGNGATSSINTSSTTRAGGGGPGGGPQSPPSSGRPGGSGGGGPGGSTGNPGTVGTTNTGGGGGGAGQGASGASGGSGIVIIRYKYQ